MENKIEIWKDVPNYDGRYQVSNLGFVRSFYKNKTRIMNGGIGTSGYPFVSLSKNRKATSIAVHQLVAICFLNHKRCKFEVVVDHIDGIKTNNKLTNLQLVTNRENSTKDKKPISGHSCIYKNNKKWLVRMRIDNVKKSFGTFEELNDAINKRDLILKDLSKNYSTILNAVKC